MKKAGLYIRNPFHTIWIFREKLGCPHSHGATEAADENE